MCGIVGYIGNKNACEVILNGLNKLEYRGYDSSGIALNIDGKIEVYKYKGRIKNLEDRILSLDLNSGCGIGHTRWATHGAPSDRNAHPHTNMDGTIALVHNGIIENFVALKEWLINEHGVEFRSETDTEVIAHLIDNFYNGDLLDAVYKAVGKMKGAYALGVVHCDEPGKIIAVRKDSPLIVGIGKDENFIASDIPALLKYTKDVYLINNDEFVMLTKDEIKIFNENRQEIKREVFHVTWDADAAEKEGFDHFMLKEIYEQPKGIDITLNRRINEKGAINLDGITITKEDLDKINRIYIVACGTAYHAGLIGKYAIEKFAKIPVEVEVASEFRYREPFIDDTTLFIAISQSGETSDTLAALREAKNKGARILTIVNVVGSSVARESDDVFYTWAGPEIAVASTKAFTTQLISVYLIALYMAEVRGTIEKEYYDLVLRELKALPDKVEKILKNAEPVKEIAEIQHEKQHAFFIGRGVDVTVALEASLKLKEISYINSFAIPAGELKHGPIALIEDGTFLTAIATQDHLYDKMLSNIQEVKARGAYVIGVAKESNKLIEHQADKVIYIPDCIDEVTPILSIVPLQLLAYYIAVMRGCDVDKPKNLAKSVTVE